MTMKVIVLAGGRGTRLVEETAARPKAMVEIGGKPVLWHIMQIYASHGVRDFLVACGYKGDLIKEYFRNAFVHNNDYIIDLKDGSLSVLNPSSIDWRVGVIDTGMETMTGGRIRRLHSLVGDETFMATYGDAVGDIDIRGLMDFHRSHGRTATVTAVRPPARFGGLTLDGDTVSQFSEKPQTEEGWINGGFFVFEPRIFDYLDGDDATLEREPMERLASENQLMAFRHRGFWQPMDTQRERDLLDALWLAGDAPWKSWK
jgi:glucose-1-phosphate cytidylyltransferase